MTQFVTLSIHCPLFGRGRRRAGQRAAAGRRRRRSRRRRRERRPRASCPDRGAVPGRAARAVRAPLASRTMVKPAASMWPPASASRQSREFAAKQTSAPMVVAVARPGPIHLHGRGSGDCQGGPSSQPEPLVPIRGSRESRIPMASVRLHGPHVVPYLQSRGISLRGLRNYRFHLAPIAGETGSRYQHLLAGAELASASSQTQAPRENDEASDDPAGK